jgi:hypothetical protein
MKCYDGEVDPEKDEERFMRTIMSKPETFLLNFFKRSWFQRIWTVQEIAAAQRPVVFCGKATMNWDKFNETLLSLTLFPRLEDINIAIQTHWFYRRYLITRGQNWQLSNTEPFERSKLIGDTEWGLLISNIGKEMVATLLYLAKGKDATVPKDKVFAIHGCLRYLDVVLPPVDYSNSINQIYREMTVAAIIHDKSLMVINLASGVLGIVERRPGLPSWVPDLSINSKTWLPKPSFKAAGASEAAFGFSDEFHRLNILGKSIDVVKAVVHVQGKYLIEMITKGTIPQQDPGSALTEVMASLRAVCRLVSPSVSYPTGETSAQGFVRNFVIWTESQDEHQLFADMFLRMCKYLDEGYRDPSSYSEEDLHPARHNISRHPEWNSFRRINTDGDTKWLFNLILTKSTRCTFFITSAGYMGIAMRPVDVSDILVLFAGMRIPLIIRKGEENYLLQASAMVHGLMEGEAWPKDRTDLHKFTLV